MALSTGCESDEQGTKQQIPIVLVSDDMSDVGGAMTAMMLASGGTPMRPMPQGHPMTSLRYHRGHKRSQNRPPASLFIRCLLQKSKSLNGHGPKTIAIQPSVAFGEDGGLGLAWCGMTDDNLGIFFVVYGPETPMGEPVVANTTEEGIKMSSVCRLKGGGYVSPVSRQPRGRA